MVYPPPGNVASLVVIAIIFNILPKAEPPVLVVLHLDVLVHDVRPLLQVLQLVVLNHRLATPAPIVVLCNFFLFALANAFVRVAFLLVGDQIDDLKDLVLDVVLVDEGQNVVFHGGEVGHLEDGGSIVVVFVQQRHHQHDKCNPQGKSTVGEGACDLFEKLPQDVCVLQ